MQRRIAWLALLVLVAVAGGPLLPEEAAAASGKITICHRTHSTTNPYRRISVNQNAITRNRGHGGHAAGAGVPAVFDPTYSYPPNDKRWGDVIPGATNGGTAYGGSASIALNWTATGIAAFAEHCAPMSAQRFYDVEIAAGRAPADVIADLNDQLANEDAALRASLPGGVFSTESIGTWDAVFGVTTAAADDVTGTTATLRGSITVGAITVAAGFEYGTSSALTSPTAVVAGPASVREATAPVAATITGLAPGTTYYFRVTGTTDPGTDTEGVVAGDVLAFTTPAVGAVAQEITFPPPGDMVAGSAAQALAASASSGLPVAYTSGSPAVCAVADGAVTALAPGSCTITASQGGDATYAAATPVARTLAVTAAGRSLQIDPSSFDPSGYTTTATPPTITATPSAGGGATTYTTATPAVCAVDADTGAVSLHRPGTCRLGASIVADGPWAAAEAAPVSFPVTAPAAVAAVRGVVWFDRDRDGTFDDGEWVLPGVRVALAPAGTAGAVGVAAEPVATTTTGADGSYRFTDVAPGAYVVAAGADIEGFDRTSDTDGAVDWSVRLEVAAEEVGVADFAGVGLGTVRGTVFDEQTLASLGSSSVTCWWAGVAGDDVPFDVVAAPDGSFALGGVPYGSFSCGASDPAGRASALAVVTVTSPAPAQVALPVPTVAPDPAQPSEPASPDGDADPAPAAARLADTGAAVGRLASAAVVLLLAGLSLRSIGRRPGSR